VLRATAESGWDPDTTPIAQLMSGPVQTVAADEILYRALGRMDRLGIRHLCVVDADGIPVGMVSQRDLLRHRARAAVMLGDAIAQADDVAALAGAHAQVADVASGLVAEGLGGTEVARVVSNEVRALTARATEIGLARLEAEGLGPAPAPWCMMVLGSGGRSESLLNADQDNALIHAGTEDDDPWFARLGAEVAEILDQAGIPRCGGGVMAANAEWRGTVQGWRARVDAWIGRARPEDLLNVDIFFDLAAVAGSETLARELHQAAVEQASGTAQFLGLLASPIAAKAPPLGLFGRVRTDADGRVDLKLGGLLPLVCIARSIGLRVGSGARSTPERLRAGCASGRLAERDAAMLIAVHAELMTLVLHQQLVDLQSGVRPSPRIELKTVDRAARKHLQGSLRALDDTLRTLRGTMV
jgi:signal-transduction protein with cAMP-binding, CBS, and nucleotidyltransferase domain